MDTKHEEFKMPEPFAIEQLWKVDDVEFDNATSAQTYARNAPVARDLRSWLSAIGVRIDHEESIVLVERREELARRLGLVVAPLIVDDPESGWRAHTGIRQPSSLNARQLVVVRFRDGAYTSLGATPDQINWRHSDEPHPADVMAYRIVK